MNLDAASINLQINVIRQNGQGRRVYIRLVFHETAIQDFGVIQEDMKTLSCTVELHPNHGLGCSLALM